MSSRWLVLALAWFALPVQAIPTIEHWQTEHGARVYFVHAPQLPMVDVRVVFDAGSARDGELPGRARFTNSMLTEGAGDLDADEIAEQLADLAAELDTNSERDMAMVSLRALSDPSILGPAVDLMGLMLAEPQFGSKAVERVRGQLLVELKQQLQSPEELARRAFYTGVFDGHPYAAPPSGVDRSLLAITAQDLQVFHERFYVASNAVVAIVGDLDRERAAKLANQVVGGLPQGTPAPALPPVPAMSASKELTIPFPSAQTHVWVGQAAIARHDDDFYALYAGNHALGGSGLVSLLSKEIREKRGLAYSVASYFTPMRAEGPYIVGLQTRNTRAAEALELLHATLTQFVQQGPTVAQLDAAKKNIIGGFPLRIASNEKILEYVAMIGFYELPLDYLKTFSERIEAVTVADVREVFARHIRPKRLLTVTVGPVPAEHEEHDAQIPEVAPSAVDST
jgi:zinc protease